jgi:hypothetical protein
MNSDVEARIRSAVSAGEFGDTAALWETYAAQVAGEIRGGRCPAAELAQMRGLIDWTRGVAICTRAQAQRRINVHLTKLHAASVYGRSTH